jgi:hypothetical protein
VLVSFGAFDHLSGRQDALARQEVESEPSTNEGLQASQTCIIKELKSETVVVGSRQWSVERAEGVMYEIAERRHCGDR